MLLVKGGAPRNNSLVCPEKLDLSEAAGLSSASRSPKAVRSR
jgi:hypothetical protein